MSAVRARLARAAYSALLRLAAPAYALRVLWRGRREPLYAERLGERFGLSAERGARGAVWVHAVSLGETRAAAALIAALRLALPDMRLLLTHVTATGRDAGRALLRDGDAQAWLPFDTPGAVRRFLRRHRPRVGVLMETEIWPNLLAEAKSAGVPMVLANARLSERSRRRGERVDALLRPAFESLAVALAQSDADAARLRDAGARTVEVVGNLKFDSSPDAALLERGREWKARVARPVVLAAVTREGEEAPLLEAWRAALPAFVVEGHARIAAPVVGVWPAVVASAPGAVSDRRRPSAPPLLVVVPRHPQRFDDVADLARAAGFTLARRSERADGPPALDADVWLGDSMGEMPLWYALADAALLGGSFAPLGGQNLIEAAACGCPVVMGPHTFNFAEAAELSLAAGAALRVGSIEAGVERALALVGAAADEERRGRAAAALAFAAAHRGAAARSASRIAGLVAIGAAERPTR